MPHRKRKKESEKKKKPADAIILVVSDGKSFFGTGIAFEIYLTDDKHKKILEGRSIGEILDGKDIDLPGYQFKIAGGTDKFGFMHHPAIEGTELKSVILSEHPGIRFTRYKVEKRGGGYKIVDLRKVSRKKTVRGRTISEYTRQINLIVLSRRGKSIKEMPKESILSDRILSPLAEKMGFLVIRNGLHRVRFIEGEDIIRLEDKIKELGFSDDLIKRISIDLGVELLKKGKKIVREVIRPVLKCRGNMQFAKYVGKVFYDLYKDLKDGKVDLSDQDKVISDIVEKIVEGTEKALKGELKIKFSFKIKKKAEKKE